MAHQLAARHIHTHDQNLAAFLLSLIAGFWMLATAGITNGFWMRGMQGMTGSTSYGEYRHQYGIYSWGGMYAWMYGRGIYGAGEWWPWFAFVAGLLVIAGGFILYLRPAQRHTWGTAIIVISALDFLFGMGGLVAATLGIVAGILALTA
jgi:hypothetical protein